MKHSTVALTTMSDHAYSMLPGSQIEPASRSSLNALDLSMDPTPVQLIRFLDLSVEPAPVPSNRKP